MPLAGKKTQEKAIKSNTSRIEWMLDCAWIVFVQKWFVLKTKFCFLPKDKHSNQAILVLLSDHAIGPGDVTCWWQTIVPQVYWSPVRQDELVYVYIYIKLVEAVVRLALLIRSYETGSSVAIFIFTSQKSRPFGRVGLTRLCTRWGCSF